MSKILVLGANGFIGRKLCSKLGESNELVLYDRFIESDNLNYPRVVRVGNFVEENDFTELMQGVSYVVHLISTTTPKEDTSDISKEILDNVLPTVKLLEAIRNLENKPTLLFVSSGGTVYGERENPASIGDKLTPICGYGMQKKTIESYIEFYARYYGIKYNIVRIANVYGYDTDSQKKQGIIPIYMRHLIEGQPITVFGDGTNIRDYIYIDDVVDALTEIINQKNFQKIYNIGSGKGYSINDVIKMMEEIVHTKFTSIEYCSSRKCDVSYNVLDIGDTIIQLEWKPLMDMKEGINLVYNQMKDFE